MLRSLNDVTMGRTITPYVSRDGLDLGKRVFVGILEEDTMLDSILFTLNTSAPREIAFCGKLLGKTEKTSCVAVLTTYHINSIDYGRFNIINKPDGALYLKAGTELFVELEVSKDREKVDWSGVKCTYTVSIFKVVDTTPKDEVKVVEEVQEPYIILSDVSLQFPLSSLVKKYMENGYVLHGGPVVDNGVIKQAMVHKNYV